MGTLNRMSANTIICETPEALAERMAEDFVKLVNSTLERQDRFTMALSGGQTPKLFYSKLAREPYRSAIPWEKFWVFWGDERCVPKEHQESNFRMAAEALLQLVSIPPAHVFRMRGEDPPPLAAREYEDELRRIFKDKEWPRFDFVLLGLGPDGHTASLMPGTPAIVLNDDGTVGGDRWVVGNVVRAMQTVRITMTFPAINHAANIWFMVTGAKKNGPFLKAQEGPNPAVPASLVEAEEGELRWYVDKAVAGQMQPTEKS